MLPLSQAMSGAATLCHAYKNSNQRDQTDAETHGNTPTKTELHAKREAGVGGGAYQEEYPSPIASSTVNSGRRPRVACRTANQTHPNDTHAEAT